MTRTANNRTHQAYTERYTWLLCSERNRVSPQRKANVPVIGRERATTAPETRSQTSMRVPCRDHKETYLNRLCFGTIFFAALVLPFTGCGSSEVDAIQINPAT